ncbi:hypothetical protein V6N11_068208 [Hibiscus sabdariffa]|uniref:Uncharacterized protein n=1 Tax=Hibiscus sabdariffa TaxID=183260 RepID=A0ABR2STZ1_9ROSI
MNVEPFCLAVSRCLQGACNGDSTELLLGGTLRKYFLSIRPRCWAHLSWIISDHKRWQIITLKATKPAQEESLKEMMTVETGTCARWLQRYHLHYNHKVDAYSFAIVLWMPMLEK